MSKLPGIRSAVNESFDDWFDRDLERFSGKQLTAATSMRRGAFHSGLSNHPSRRFEERPERAASGCDQARVSLT